MFSKALIIGSWEVIRSEIPNYKAGEEFLHFSPTDLHVWEYPFSGSSRKTWAFKYRMTNDGFSVHYPKSSKSWNVKVEVEGRKRVITGPHGFRSWLRRLKRPKKGLEYFFPYKQEIGST